MSVIKPLKQTLILLFIFIITVASVSCAEKEIDTAEVVRAMMNSDCELPTGILYRKDSSPGSPDYLSESLLASLYGSGESPDVFERVNSGCVFLTSGKTITEFSVFACVSVADAEEIASLCRRRGRILKYNIDGEFSAFVYDKNAIFAFCETSEACTKSIKAAKSALKH